VARAVLEQLRFSAYDLPTRDKIPLLRRLAGEGAPPGLALDVGVGTGYTTFSVFGSRPTVCLDVDPANLRYYRDRLRAVPGARPPLCVAAAATALPFRDGVFASVLCSEVLEHLDDDAGAMREIVRVLGRGGQAVLTVPYTGLGFTSFLELCRVKTVHDHPGPEYHVRPGYDEAGLRRLITDSGAEVAWLGYTLRFFTRLATDLVGAAHLGYQRLVHGRRAWTWAEAAGSEGSAAFRLYARCFPALRALVRLDGLLRRRRGFGLVAVARKP
jgi:SAM-dependent methyltransferase